VRDLSKSWWRKYCCLAWCSQMLLSEAVLAAMTRVEHTCVVIGGALNTRILSSFNFLICMSLGWDFF
jgi:hypothetical protein